MNILDTAPQVNIQAPDWVAWIIIAGAVVGSIYGVWRWPLRPALRTSIRVVLEAILEPVIIKQKKIEQDLETLSKFVHGKLNGVEK